MGFLSRFRVKPVVGETQQKVPGEFLLTTSLDVSELSPQERRDLHSTLSENNLTVEYDSDAKVMKVSGKTTLFYSRGTDQSGNRAIWITADDPIVNLIFESICLIYASKDWGIPSQGRLMRAVLAQIGQVTLPDGTEIFVGPSEDYESSMLSSDGAKVYPRLTDNQKQMLGYINATSDDVIDEDEDPFK